ncbi:MAG: flagellar basal body P-ring protein FlgI [Phycisphaerales bacterium]|nr:flagellar basal body P-ring protein FlgI [Phycisphaerales bacterium]
MRTLQPASRVQIILSGVLGLLLSFFLLPTAALCQPVTARVGDVTKVHGLGRNTLIGMGLVTGLKQSGDGAKFLPTMQALARELNYFAANVETLDDIKDAKDAAIVRLQAFIPEEGIREGERIDVFVSAYAAKSLEGGHLLVAPMVYDDPAVTAVLAKATGPIELQDPKHPTTGVIRGGALMEEDIFHNVVVTGAELQNAGLTSGWIHSSRRYVTLVLTESHAGWSAAAAVATAVDNEVKTALNEEETTAAGGRAALAIDSKNIVVMVPQVQYDDPASFIRDITQLPLLMDSNEARVTINRQLQTIVVSGDVKISPTVVSHQGLTLTVAAPANNAAPTAGAEPQVFVPLDEAAARQSNMNQLLEALNRLKVPFDSRVQILVTLEQSGNLHAKVYDEG